MTRHGVMVGLALLASCASAGEAPVDARPMVDAARPVDAPMIDAAVDLCPSTATCQSAMVLGQVSGDTGNQKLTAMGHQSAWLRVRVTEDNNDVPGLTLRGAARLTSPPGVDFDVIVYVNSGSDVVECSTTVGTTTTNGAVNQVRAEWGEGAIPNGVSDSRHMSIEIRPVSGACSPGAMWQLEVEGNWE